MKKTDLYKNAGLAVANQMKNSVPKQGVKTKKEAKSANKVSPLLASLLKNPK
jgi:hypothetical protein